MKRPKIRLGLASSLDALSPHSSRRLDWTGPKYNRALELLAGRFHEPAIPQEQKADVALVALQLADPAAPIRMSGPRRSAERSGSDVLRPDWNKLLADAANRMEPHVACQVLTVPLRSAPGERTLSPRVLSK